MRPAEDEKITEFLCELVRFPQLAAAPVSPA
jgi:hypothetical protein